MGVNNLFMKAGAKDKVEKHVKKWSIPIANSHCKSEKIEYLGSRINNTKQ